MEYLKKHWRGEGKLWSAFWIVGVLGKLAIAIILPFVLFFFATKMQNDGFINLLKIWGYVILYSYVIFALICIWRCSKNTKNEVFTAIAKIYVIFIPILVIYVYVRP